MGGRRVAGRLHGAARPRDGAHRHAARRRDRPRARRNAGADGAARQRGEALPPGAVSMSARVFLLSPARCDGERAKLVFNPRAEFALARALREERGGGVELGEAFSFLSGLYFRGKLAYARTFARPPRGVPGALIITTDRGLVSAETRVRLEDLRAFACVDIGRADERFRAPLRKDVVRLAKRLRPGDDVVLLGSIATGKYVDTLVDVFGERLLFPQ